MNNAMYTSKLLFSMIYAFPSNKSLLRVMRREERSELWPAISRTTTLELIPALSHCSPVLCAALTLRYLTFSFQAITSPHLTSLHLHGPGFIVHTIQWPTSVHNCLGQRYGRSLFLIITELSFYCLNKVKHKSCIFVWLTSERCELWTSYQKILTRIGDV